MIDWEKQFPIANINRADLTEFGYSDEQIATLFPDEVMEEIATEMEGSYFLNFPFREDLQRAIQSVLGQKDKQTRGCLAFYENENFEAFTKWLATVKVREIHADGEEEERPDIDIHCVPACSKYLIVHDGLTFCVVCRAENDADFKFQSGSDVLYARYCWERDELSDLRIVEFGQLTEAIAWVRQHKEKR